MHKSACNQQLYLVQGGTKIRHSIYVSVWDTAGEPKAQLATNDITLFNDEKPKMYSSEG